MRSSGGPLLPCTVLEPRATCCHHHGHRDCAPARTEPRACMNQPIVHAIVAMVCCGLSDVGQEKAGAPVPRAGCSHHKPVGRGASRILEYWAPRRGLVEPREGIVKGETR